MSSSVFPCQARMLCCSFPFAGPEHGTLGFPVSASQIKWPLIKLLDDSSLCNPLRCDCRNILSANRAKQLCWKSFRHSQRGSGGGERSLER